MSPEKKKRLKQGGIFVPLIFSFGAVLEDISINEFLEDPTKLSNTLRTIQNYFQVDGVVSYGDTMALSESLGYPLSKDKYPPVVKFSRALPVDFEDRLKELPHVGRVATAVEVTKRLNILLPDSILLCMVPGPVTLAGQLTGQPCSQVLIDNDLLGSAAKAVLTFTKALGHGGIDIVIIQEKILPILDDETAKIFRRCYTPIWNTAKFYDIFPLLMIEEFLQENIDRLQKITDGIIYPANKVPEISSKAKRLSLALPISLLEKEHEEIETFFSQIGIFGPAQASRLFLVTTNSEVPNDINKELMIRGIQIIRDYLKN